MISKKHKKHGQAVMPSYGNFGRNEWSLVGASCTAAQQLADRIIEVLSPLYNCGYLDANHSVTGNSNILPGRLHAGASQDYTNQVNYHQLNFKKELNPFGFRKMFADADFILVNGNHYQASAQVVILDLARKASLQKRLPELTNVQLILATSGQEEVFDFLKQAVPKWQQVPLYNISETEKIVAFFQLQMEQAKPPLNGLVLAGGRSIRMGLDKGSIKWHEKEQRYYMADMLMKYCSRVFISCRPDQVPEVDHDYPAIEDSFTGLGPYGGILSAFREHPDHAWLVTACDLPFLDDNLLQHLISNRSVRSIATTFESPVDGMPEPLITIWEPKSYPVLLSFLSLGYTCPRKVLINSDVKILKPEHPAATMNVNTPADLEQAKMMMR